MITVTRLFSHSSKFQFSLFTFVVEYTYIQILPMHFKITLNCCTYCAPPSMFLGYFPVENGNICKSCCRVTFSMENRIWFALSIIIFETLFLCFVSMKFFACGFWQNYDYRGGVCGSCDIAGYLYNSDIFICNTYNNSVRTLLQNCSCLSSLWYWGRE